MKKFLALVLSLIMLMGIFTVSASAVNEDVEGTIGIYSSMYQFVIDMMDEAIKAEFPNLTPAFDGSFFFYGGTSSLITKVYGEMETGTLGCDMIPKATGILYACATWCLPITRRWWTNGLPRA